MFYNGVFRDPETGHEERDVKGVGVFHFSANVRGVEYIPIGDTACQGMSVVINGKMSHWLVQTTENEVTVTTEHFELSTLSMTTLSTDEQLLCSPTSQGCRGACHAYSWIVPVTMDCPLQAIWSTVMCPQDGLDC